MPFSAGVFSRVYSWATEQASPPIEISKLDTQEIDVATALSNCILRDGTGLPVAAIPWNAQKITGLGDASADTDALNRQTADARYLLLKKYKSAVTARTSTTTLTDDPDLASLALASGAAYVIDLLLLMDSSNTGVGFKVNLYFTGTRANAGPHGVCYSVGGSLASSAFTIQSVSGTASITSSTVSSTAFSGIVSASLILLTSTSGNLSVQWAQNSSNGTALNLREGSFMKATKIS